MKYTIILSIFFILFSLKCIGFGQQQKPFYQSTISAINTNKNDNDSLIEKDALLQLDIIKKSIKSDILSIAKKLKCHSGFYLYDPITKKELISLNGDKYFTPSSNTKIFTFYSSLQVLPDSIPAFRYIQTDTALFIWGLADPSFLNKNFPYNDSYSFLTQYPSIYFSMANFKAPRFGLGWAWDDYNENFSQERWSFPIYGNSILFTLDSLTKSPKIEPSFFIDSVSINKGEHYKVKRSEFSNTFEWDISPCNNCKKTRAIYFRKDLFKKLLLDTLKIPVTITNSPLPPAAKTFYSIPTDSLLKIMMLESDNFIAEHLLLNCGAMLTDTLSTTLAIREMSKRINRISPDKLIWKDASGLSRYNLFTPRSIVFLWEKIYKDIGESRLFSLLPVGGKSGTLKNWDTEKLPYIYGKTGTLSNNFSLSGFIITTSGRKLIFSYMNNNYPVPLAEVKNEMKWVLKKIHEKY